MAHLIRVKTRYHLKVQFLLAWSERRKQRKTKTLVFWNVLSPLFLFLRRFRVFDLKGGWGVGPALEADCKVKSWYFHIFEAEFRKCHQSFVALITSVSAVSDDSPFPPVSPVPRFRLAPPPPVQVWNAETVEMNLIMIQEYKGFRPYCVSDLAVSLFTFYSLSFGIHLIFLGYPNLHIVPCAWCKSTKV